MPQVTEVCKRLYNNIIEYLKHQPYRAEHKIWLYHVRAGVMNPKDASYYGNSIAIVQALSELINLINVKLGICSYIQPAPSERGVSPSAEAEGSLLIPMRPDAMVVPLSEWDGLCEWCGREFPLSETEKKQTTHFICTQCLYRESLARKLNIPGVNTHPSYPLPQSVPSRR